MTAEQLEELLGKVTPGEWHVDKRETRTDARGETIYDPPRIVWPEEEKSGSICKCHLRGGSDPDQARFNATLIALAPSLARRVIAAEKLVEALEELPLGDGPLSQLVTAYREASK